MPGVAFGYEGVVDAPTQPPPPPKIPQVTKAPTLATTVDATYPTELLSARVGGDVVLLIDIAADGTVPNVEVTRSSGRTEFDVAAVAALKQFRFTPAEIDGQPAAIRVEYVYHFEPRAPPEPEVTAPPPPPPINFTGRVLERGTKEPLPGSTVFLPGSQLVAETDLTGRFEIRGVPAGTQVVEVKDAGHVSATSDVLIKDGEATDLTIYLWPKLEGAFQTVVKGERVKTEVARRTLERAELTSVPGTFGDALRVIQNLPGLSRPPLVSGQLIVRGSAPGDTQTLIDGVPIPLLYHFLGGPSVISSQMIDRIDFYPGAYGARYGRAIAGVIDVATREPEAKRFKGNFKVDLLDAGFFLEGPLVEGSDVGSWSVGARRSYIDVFLPFILDAVRQPGQAVFATSPNYWDYQSRLDLKLGPGKLDMSVFGSSDVLDFTQKGTITASGFAAKSEQSFHRARMKYTLPTDSGWVFSLAPTIGTTSVSFAFNAGTPVFGKINSIDFNTRGVAKKEFGKALSLETGVEFNTNVFDLNFQLQSPPEYQTFPGEAPDTPINTRSFGITTASQAAYAQAVWQPLEALSVIPGLRLENFLLEAGPEVVLDPRIAVRYTLNDALTLKAAWGLHHQGPTPMNLDYETGNPFLGLAQSSQVAGGFEAQLADKLSLDLQVFRSWRTQLEVASSARVERDGKQVVERYNNDGVGESYGLEFLLKRDITERFFGWISYTLSQSSQRNGPGKEWILVSSDQTHILTAIGSYKLAWGIEAGLRFRLTSGRPTTPVIGSTNDSDTGGFIRVNGKPGSERTDTFRQLDFRLEKLFTFETWKLAVYLDIQNVTNASNAESILFDYRFQNSAPQSGLPIIPTLGVNGSF